MKLSPMQAVSLLLLGLFLPVCQAQEKPKAEERPKSEVQTTPVKALIVFTEYEGDKKIKSLPYTLYINAPDASDWRGPATKLRVGSRVPVYTGKDQLTYMDVGTNIDARAVHTPEGRFLLGLSLERSWVEEHIGIRAAADQDFREPVVRQFRSDLELKLHEGQVIESTMATDPLSGKIMKVEVSLSIVK